MVINKETTCRVCLIESKPDEKIEFQSIFEKDIENIEIATKIAAIGGIVIIQNDQKPVGICGSCFELLNIAYGFRISCQNSEIKLNELINLPNEIKVFKEEPIENKETVSDNGHTNTEDLKQEATISKRPKRTSTQKQQIKIENDSDVDFDFSEFDNDRDYFKKTGDKKLEKKRKKSTIKNKRIKLLSSVEDNGETKNIEKYDNNDDDDDTKCLEGIEKNENSKKEKRKYIRKKPKLSESKPAPTIEELTCDICLHVFKNKKLMQVHVKLVHIGKKDYVCETCGACFANQFKLICHSHTHTGERPYACRYCPKAFRNSSNRRVHEMRLHTHIKPFSCEFCGKDWHTSHQLKKHRRVHTGEKPYICEVCGTGFKARNHLNAHMKSLVPCIVKMNLKNQAINQNITNNQQLPISKKNQNLTTTTIIQNISNVQQHQQFHQGLKKEIIQQNSPHLTSPQNQVQQQQFQNLHHHMQNSLQSPPPPSIHSVGSPDPHSYQ